MIQKLTKEKFYQIIKEEFSGIFTEKDNVDTSIETKDYSSLSSSLMDMASKMNLENKKTINNEISKALKNGNTNVDYNFYGKDKC